MKDKIFFPLFMMVLIVAGLYFWIDNIYYLVFCVPAIMFLAGCVMYCIGEKSDGVRSWLLGYRTGMSERNEDTWQFANQYCGRLCMRWSVVLLIFSELLMLLWRPSPAQAELFILVQLITVIATFPVTEKALSNTFDRQGNRKSLDRAPMNEISIDEH